MNILYSIMQFIQEKLPEKRGGGGGGVLGNFPYIPLIS